MSTTTTRRLFGARPQPGALLDIAIAAAALAGSLSLLSPHGKIVGTGHGWGDLSLGGIALVAWATLPLMAWRRFPLGVFIVTATASVLLAGLGYSMPVGAARYSVGLMLGPSVALYLLAASRQRDAPWTRRSSAVIIGFLLAHLGATAAARGAFPGSELFHTGLLAAVAWFAGERTRLVRAQIAELKARVEYAEREAERERRLAAAEERARIARDLHDSAGHAINVIAVRAGAARLRYQQDPERSLQALEVIEEVARQTAAEIDQIVGTLRQDGRPNGGVEAPVGLASLDTLIAHHAAAGLDVTLTRTGAPHELGRTSDQAAYRILQEALTNAARHGTGSAMVELAFGDESLALSVANPVPTNGRSRSGGGHGLTGIRERVHLLGGEFDSDDSSAMFRVQARLPYRGRHA